MELSDELFMAQALLLAEGGIGHVAPNPMVGALLVYKEVVIGRGYHQQYGEAHAEVNCFNSVQDDQKHLIPKSTLYVTLEPCSHHGKTPPCSDRIINEGVKRVVVAVQDPHSKVDGKGIQQLIDAGIEVKLGILEAEARFQNRRFFCFHDRNRPYVMLKWAQTLDHFIGNFDSTRLLITDQQVNKQVHQWRAEEQAILVGTDTALKDDPLLTNRLAPGKSPLRVVLDFNLRLPLSLRIFQDGLPTFVINHDRDDSSGSVQYIKISKEKKSLVDILQRLYELNIHSVLVEGGAKLLSSFIQEELWDEIRLITNESLLLGNGVASPTIPKQVQPSAEIILGYARVHYYYRSI